tara:strand:- start:1033 stop:1401 length:369 start_codon:yes stop_codon:yes gene_type:complete
MSTKETYTWNFQFPSHINSEFIQLFIGLWQMEINKKKEDHTLIMKMDISNLEKIDTSCIMSIGCYCLLNKKKIDSAVHSIEIILQSPTQKKYLDTLFNICPPTRPIEFKTINDLIKNDLTKK